MERWPLLCSHCTAEAYFRLMRWPNSRKYLIPISINLPLSPDNHISLLFLFTLSFRIYGLWNEENTKTEERNVSCRGSRSYSFQLSLCWIKVLKMLPLIKLGRGKKQNCFDAKLLHPWKWQLIYFYIKGMFLHGRSIKAGCPWKKPS